MVIIGVDPHPDSHTAAALDTNGKVLGTLTVKNTAMGLDELQHWAGGFQQRRWAIEGANNPFVTELSRPLAESEAVVDISPSLTSQYRSKRGRRKTDEVDAVNIARAALANSDLPPFKPTGDVDQLKELVRTRERLSGELRGNRLALRQVSKGCIAHEVLAELVNCLEAQLKLIDIHLRQLVEKIMPELLELRGVGVVHTATILAEAGNVERFRSKDAFASYCGCAPVERSSGRNQRMQVNTGGNRRLNRTCYLITLVRLRTEVRSRELVRRKEQEGKTFRAALRVLKTYVSREIYSTMRRSWAPDLTLGPCS
jgi:transposase